MSQLHAQDCLKRRIPALITYLNPFRIIERETSSKGWSATIDEVNKQDWDYVALHEMVGGIDVGLEAPYHMALARDGALALPPMPGLRNDQAAVEFFNRCLAALLLGGVYCEAVNLDSLDMGCIIDWKYIRSLHNGSSASNLFHQHVRLKSASALEAIQLYKPRTILVDDISIAMRTGLAALRHLEPVRGEFLLKGSTGLARRDWGAAVANMWIVIEQLLEALWQREIVKPVRMHDESKARRDQLNDHRSWTAATRIEMLHQKGIIDLSTLRDLSKARKARNDLAHAGIHPSESDSNACLAGARAMISLVLKEQKLPFLALDLNNHAMTDPFAPPKNEGRLEPEFWMPIPKLPGEEELEKAEAAHRSKSHNSSRITKKRSKKR